MSIFVIMPRYNLYNTLPCLTLPCLALSCHAMQCNARAATLT